MVLELDLNLDTLAGMGETGKLLATPLLEDEGKTVLFRTGGLWSVEFEIHAR